MILFMPFMCQCNVPSLLHIQSAICFKDENQLQCIKNKPRSTYFQHSFLNKITVYVESSALSNSGRDQRPVQWLACYIANTAGPPTQSGFVCTSVPSITSGVQDKKHSTNCRQRFRIFMKSELNRSGGWILLRYCWLVQLVGHSNQL